MKASLTLPIDAHLHPGETFVFRSQHQRGWTRSLILFLPYAAACALIWVMFHYLDRSIVHTYINLRADSYSSEFIALNLFLGVLPFLMMAALLLNYIHSFFSELSLTDRRIIGRVSGPFWMRRIDIPLDCILSITRLPMHLSIVMEDRRHYIIYGLPNLDGFMAAYRQQQLGYKLDSDEFFEPLPDAFTFNNV